MYHTSDCVFCKECRFLNNYRNGFSLAESLIYENEYIYITPDLSPLVIGHLLIVSQKHFNSFASAPDSVKEALDDAIDYLYNNYGYKNMTWFEHGAVIPGQGGASIDHAHLHVLPCQIDLQSKVEENPVFFDMHEYSRELFDSLAYKQPYLWISSGRKKSKIYFVNRVHSQYLRKQVADFESKIDYNWKNNYAEESTISRYRESLRFIMSMRKANARNI